MINRNYLRCLTCHKDLTLRTAIGHGDYQEFAFPCPGCGIEIRYGMSLYPTEARFEYSKIQNAEWIKPQSEPQQILTLDPETLIPIGLPTPFSPFIATSHLARDVLQFHRDRVLRLQLCLVVWPILRNCKVHFDNSNWNLYQSEFRKLDPTFALSEGPLYIAHFLQQLDSFGQAFRPYSGPTSSMLRQRINYAESLRADLCNDFLGNLRDLGWSEQLFKELISLKDRWASIYLIVQPVYLSLYWDSSKYSLDDYSICQKRFNELKSIFIDLFETLARISVVAATLEGIILHQAIKVPTKKKLLDIEAYLTMNNGTKLSILRNLVVANTFSEIVHYRLRNGIGHHSAHYDIGTDSVNYRNESKKGQVNDTISYTKFCERLILLYIQFEVSSIYINWITAREYGLKGRVV